MYFLRPIVTAIIEALRLQPTDQVLDVATGTGEPGLSLARLAPQGHVTGFDLSAGIWLSPRKTPRARTLPTRTP